MKNSLSINLKRYILLFLKIFICLLFLPSFIVNSQAINNQSLKSNIFYHPATEDPAWVYNNDGTYTTTGLNGASGLRVNPKVYKGDQVLVSFTLSETYTEGNLFAMVDKQKVRFTKGETEFSHLFTITSESTRNLRIGVDTFPKSGIVLSNIKFLLIEKNKPEPNTPPQANAGVKQIVTSMDNVTLNASRSLDKESTITYQWKLLGDTSTDISIINSDTVQAEFIVPNLTVAETFHFELTVTDSEGLTNTDVVEVIALPNDRTSYDNIFYHPATEDKAWIYNGNETYISTGLNGESGLRVTPKVTQNDQILVSFKINEAYKDGNLFARVDGRKVNLKKGETYFSHLFTIASTSSRDLRVGADTFPQSGILLSEIEFLLIPGNSNKLPINSAPIAKASAPELTFQGDFITLDASASTDDSQLKYQWHQIDNTGVVVELDDVNNVKPSFITPKVETPETLSFKVTVTDEQGLSDTAVVNILATLNFTNKLKPSSDTNFIYVSSDGNDDTAKVVSSSNVIDPLNPNINLLPFKTLKGAISKLRDGYPDWILLKRGDIWENESFGVIKKSGRNENERIVIAYYGESGDRPLIKPGSDNGIVANNKLTSNIAISGLDFYAHTRDPQSADYIEGTVGNTGIAFIGGGDNILIEDTLVRYFKNGITVQSYDGKEYTNFELRHSIVTNSYSINSHSQGLYIEGVNGILLEDNLFDHNGWNKYVEGASATKFNHNVYMQTNNIGENIIVKNNIISRGSSHGIHGRAGGLFENNLFISNSISLQLGYITTPLVAGTLAHAKDNVILSGKLMDPTGQNYNTTKAVWGLYTETNALDAGGEILVENNLVSNAEDQENSNLDYTEVSGGIYQGNLSFNWNYENDNFDPNWKDPTVTIEDYMASIGEEPTLEEFIHILSTRELNSWNKAFTATQVNQYIRSGFNK